MRTIGFGIVGCGYIGGVHARALAEVRGARLIAVASRNEAKARQIAEQHAAVAFSDYHKMLALPDLDVVSIATPSGAHAEIAIAAARAGKHILCEKPLEITLKRIDAMLAAARKHRVKLAGIFQSRFGEGAQTVKRAVAAGRLGKLTLCDAYIKWWRDQNYYDSGGWRGTWQLDGGGALMNQSIHAIDLLQWLAGMPGEIRAFTALRAHKRIEVEDVAIAALRFKSGALGVIEAATAAWPGFSKRIELSGDRGTIVLEDDRIVCWKFSDEQPEDQEVRAKFSQSAVGGGAGGREISHEGHRRQFQDMADAVREGRAPGVSGEDGRRAVEIILGIYQSARTGRTVQLPLKS